MYIPLVSIIVPNYNYSNFLKQRLDSIFSQTYNNYEVIILDDASTDNSMDVINHYADNPHVSSIIRNEKNSGSPFKQWQKGISMSKGEIIWIAESDDYCKPDMLERLVKAYTDYNCTLAFTRSLAVDENGKPMYVCQRMLRKDNHWKGTTFIKRYLNTGNRIYNASSVIFSKKAALNADKTFMTFKECGDWVFWCEIAVQGIVAVISDPLNYFRRSSNGTQTTSMTLNGTADIEDYRVMEYLKKKNVYSPYHIFIKKKRMAKRHLYNQDLYANKDVINRIMKECHLPKYYYWLARISHLYHKIFK